MHSSEALPQAQTEYTERKCAQTGASSLACRSVLEIVVVLRKNDLLALMLNCLLRLRGGDYSVPRLWMIKERTHPKAPLKANDDGPFQRTHVVYQKKELPDRDEFRKLTMEWNIFQSNQTCSLQDASIPGSRPHRNLGHTSHKFESLTQSLACRCARSPMWRPCWWMTTDSRGDDFATTDKAGPQRTRDVAVAREGLPPGRVGTPCRPRRSRGDRPTVVAVACEAPTNKTH